MSTITAAYLSYTSWSISQASTAASDGGNGNNGAASAASSAVTTSSVTSVSISYRAKQLYARASTERSVVDRLQAQVNAFRTDRSVMSRGQDAGSSHDIDIMKIVSGSSNDVIKAYIRGVTIDSGAGNDRIDTYGNAH